MNHGVTQLWRAHAGKNYRIKFSGYSRQNRSIASPPLRARAGGCIGRDKFCYYLEAELARWLHLVEPGP